MALIQIRDVPDETYETIRRRARQAGQSIQKYMLAHIIEFADEPTTAEVLAEIEADLAIRPRLELSTQEILDARDHDRRY